MRRRVLSPALLLMAAVASAATGAAAQDGGGLTGWMSGEWSLTIGATGMVAPSYQGGKKYLFSVSPIISLGKKGPEARFSSRNDGISLALLDSGAVRAGLAGKLIFPRDGGDDDDLIGLDPIRFGGEAGGFAEFYPTDWMRIRGEVRHGIRSHDGVVADVQVDAFADVTDTLRVSAGPRLSFASENYFDAYYGVDAGEALASGLSAYDPGGGIKSVGVGGAVSWKATDQVTTTVFTEYSRLMGPAADSSLVRERGSRNQFTVGMSASYRFDFEM